MSRIHLLDTNVFRFWVDGAHERHSSVVEKVGELGDSYVFLSPITVGEVESGLSRPHGLDASLVEEIRRALMRFRVQGLDRHVSELYGVLRAWLVENHAPRNRRRKLRSLSELIDPVTDLELGIQENDLWLVSQAVATDAVLVTSDRLTVLARAAEETGLDLHLARW